MSARKLQQEFDKTNKKIAEGLSAFDEIHDKLVTTEISSQKEKLELDLKKEIKKLQRLRDQLKTWLSDSSIKLDKNLLQENRTRIEHAMDLFKDLEKLSKIKQFSNEGLELQSQRLGRFNKFSDPEDHKKHEAFNYITNIIDQLSSQSEGLEDQVHQLTLLLKRARLLHALSIQVEIDDIKYRIERHSTHMKKLEMILQGLENDNLDPDRIEDIKDDLEYYVDNNMEDDYVEYDDFYEQLDIDDDNLEVHGSLAQMAADGVEAEEAAAAAAAAAAADAAKADATKTGEIKPAEIKTTEAVKTTETVKTNEPVKTSPAPDTPTKKEKVKIEKESDKSSGALVAAPPPVMTAGSYSSAIKAAQSTPVAARADVNKSPKSQSGNLSGQSGQPSGQPTSASGHPPGLSRSATVSPQETEEESDNETKVQLTGAAKFFDTIPRLATIPQSRINHPLPFELISQLLESSLLNCPDSFDAEKPRLYNPVKVHPSLVDYPQEPMYELNLASVMKKFDNDTLFFCFYYLEGSDNYAKWNAARELSARGWVFNTESKQWFKKDNKKTRSMSVIQPEDELEPVDLGDANKEENYKYFDYEKTWLTRRKEAYKFGAGIRQQFV